jgi:NH3-dependent NAD+ synthetase
VNFTPSEDIVDAKKLADELGIQTREISIEEINEAFIKTLGYDPSNLRQRIPAANIVARLRMIILY